MSHICILDLTSSPTPDLLSAKLTIATIDDRTGAMINPPHHAGNGTLNAELLIRLNRQVIENFQTATCQDKYFGGIQLPDTIVSNVADLLNELQTDIQELQQLLDRTLAQDSWSRIREELLHSLIGIDPNELIRLVILTDNHDIQALPLERTSFITNMLGGGNRSVSVVFAPQKQPKKLVWHHAPKVLLMLGSQKDIEQPISEDEIKKYFPAPAIFTLLQNPSREEVLKVISDRSFDMIIMVGHSRANKSGTDGKININDRDSISIQEFTKPFQNSVNNGLKLVILAGCSSIGVARALASNNIGVPNVIAFRVPVHYRVLRLFFDRLLNYWIDRSQSLEMALTNTRAELSIYDRDCPGASILPILFTSPYDPPLKFPIQTLWSKILHIMAFSPLVPIKVRGKEMKMKIPPIGLIGLAAAAILLARLLPSLTKLEAVCNHNVGDGISCGEESLLTEISIRPQVDKQAGANAIAQGEYDRAIPLLTRAWTAKNDPETLIMLENAKLELQQLPIKSIALTIPASQSTPIDVPTAMLKAVAFAQQQWNADLDRKWKLRVVLVDDKNDKDTAPNLADRLLKRGILAGIGSYSSVVTLPVKDIYKKHETVMISGTSTATSLTNISASNFFYRTCSTNEVSGREIANYLKNHKYTKIALFHTPGGAFSDSMTTALKANIGSIGIVKDANFEGKSPAIDALKQAKLLGAQAIVLIPDAYTSADPERDRLLSIIRQNNGDLPIIGNEVIKDQTLFNFSKQQLQKIVISLPWHPSSYQNNRITPPSYWGDKSNLDHRIAMTYDAAQVIIKALDALPIDGSVNSDRKRIQEFISNPNSKINGITGQIGFMGSDRSQPVNSLVQPKCDDTKCSGFKPAI